MRRDRLAAHHKSVRPRAGGDRKAAHPRSNDCPAIARIYDEKSALMSVAACASEMSDEFFKG